MHHGGPDKVAELLVHPVCSRDRRLIARIEQETGRRAVVRGRRLVLIVVPADAR